MKPTLFAAALLMTLSWAAVAAAAPAADLPHTQVPQKPSEDEVAREKQDVEASCRATVQQSSFVDCACLADKVAAQRAAAPNRSWQSIVPEVAAQCPADKRTISDYVFTSCDGYYKTERTDHEAFCRCSGDKTADQYIAKPVFNQRYIENLRRVSLQGCGIADNSHRIDREAEAAAAATKTPAPVNLATADCVQWKSNEADMAWHERMAASGHVTGDVLLVNGCQSPIWVVQTAADTSHRDDPLDECYAEQLPPIHQKVLRSQSPSTRPGLIKVIPKVPAFVCAGPAAMNSNDTFGESRCACAAGVAKVLMPDPSTLR
jgi:hypothetical protein